MKKKTYIKEGVYQKSNKKIGGALDLNKEVLDTLVDKGVIGTTNCCQYYLTPANFDSIEDVDAAITAGTIPLGAFYIVSPEGQDTVELGFIRRADGGLVRTSLYD